MIVDAIRTQAKDILETGEVGSVVGWRVGSRGMEAEPVTITEPDEASQLIWDPTCYHNLSLYLVEEKRRRSKQGGTKPMAIVAKGCDARSVTVLLQENYFKREEVYVIGVSCEGSGMLDQGKLNQKFPGVEPDKAAFDGANFVLDVGGEPMHVPAQELMADRCLECRDAHPRLANVTYGTAQKRELAEPFAALKRFEALPADKRWQFWERQFDRCIRCFACRSVCPMCYCEECVVDSIQLAVDANTTATEKANRLRWIERSNTRSDNIGYHMTRALHLAGRCIDCAECERVCPVHIPLRLLNNKLEREARDAFGYEPGASVDIPSLVSSFRDDDPNQFIR